MARSVYRVVCGWAHLHSNAFSPTSAKQNDLPFQITNVGCGRTNSTHISSLHDCSLVRSVGLSGVRLRWPAAPALEWGNTSRDDDGRFVVFWLSAVSNLQCNSDPCSDFLISGLGAVFSHDGQGAMIGTVWSVFTDRGSGRLMVVMAIPSSEHPK
jgi:hypothetical protein